MNKTQISKNVIPCLLAGLLLPIAAWAQPGDGQGPSVKRGSGAGPDGPRRERIRKEFDADKDGKLSEEERAAAREKLEARKVEVLEKFDADNDGELSKAEREAAMTARREARRAEILEKYDADKDGELSETERAKVREEMGPPPEKRKEMRDRAKEHFDKDGDGKLSDAEREVAREQMKQRRGQKPDRKGPPAE